MGACRSTCVLINISWETMGTFTINETLKVSDLFLLQRSNGSGNDISTFFRSGRVACFSNTSDIQMSFTVDRERVTGLTWVVEGKE